MTDRRLVLDRIEGDLAVLVDGEGRTVSIPTPWLPDGLSEGQGLRLEPASVEEVVDEARDRLARLAAGSPEGDLDL